MTEVIDGTKIIAILAEVVEGMENHTAFCTYRHMGYADDGFTTVAKPHCIAGVVVDKVGGQQALLNLAEGSAIYGNTSYRGKNAHVLESLGFTDEAAQILQQAQTSQDNGYSWGTAFSEAQQKAAQLALEASE